MPFKTKKNRTILKKIILYSFISFLGTSHIEQSMAGSSTSAYVDPLIDGLIEYLVKHKVCDSKNTCGKMIEARTEGTKRVYINIYNQTNIAVISHAVAFFTENAMKLTEGTPVTLSFYPKSHDDYMGFKYAFGNNEYLINLELNKGKNHAL